MDFNELVCFCKDLSIEFEIDGKTAPLTSIKVGGSAKLIAHPSNIQDFCDLIAVLNKNSFKYCIIGNGSNVYFCDHYNGVVIVTDKINNISVADRFLTAECGASILSCARMSLCHSLSGLEFAYGIPGTIGGALYMNAEAFGSRFSDIVYKSIVFNIENNTLIELYNDEQLFSSKSSIFSKNRNYILLKTVLALNKNEFENIKSLMLTNMKKRSDTQPLNLPNAGSAFKRNNGIIPSKLIDQIGLKGYRIGGIEISKKHAGFFVNSGDATAEDINELLAYIKMRIFTEFKVKLEEEIIYIK